MDCSRLGSSIQGILQARILEWAAISFSKMTKTIPKKKKRKEAKWLSEEALQITEKRREMKGKAEREIYPTECRVLENSKER